MNIISVYYEYLNYILYKRSRSFLPNSIQRYNIIIIVYIVLKYLVLHFNHVSEKPLFYNFKF